MCCVLNITVCFGAGSRRMSATARPSVSHGIVEDTSELLSGFATAGDRQSESVVDCPDDYWDSDTYEDDDDPGYHRQPIEDEEWFLAHEIDYPSEDEGARPNVENLRRTEHDKDSEKDNDDDDHSCVEEEVCSRLKFLLALPLIFFAWSALRRCVTALLPHKTHI
jgi:hypothetical protein